MKTELKNRILWFDGTSQVAPDLVPELLLEGANPENLIVTKLNDDIVKFNLFSDIQIQCEKLQNKELNYEYLIPQKYKDINLAEHLAKCLDGYGHEYFVRVTSEMIEIKDRDMDMLIKSLIYVVDRFKETKQIWGIGRGSSCASLVLYLIGLHQVDPVKYKIPMEEFFH